MDDFNTADESVHPLMLNLKEIIREKHFEPLIQQLRQSKLHERKTVQELLCCLQNLSARLECTFLACSDIKFDQLSDLGKQQLCAIFNSGKHEVLKNNIIALSRLYLDPNRQKDLFPQMGRIKLQTCIRELFHEYLNPLPQLKIYPLDLYTEDRLKHSSAAYFKYKNIPTFNPTSQFVHFSPVPERKRIAIFYCVAGEVQITRERSFFDVEMDIVLRKSIPEKELVSSLSQVKEVKLFRSLYQALEYAHALHHGGHLLQSVVHGFIPPVWIVDYKGGKLSYLDFTQEKIVLDERGSHDRDHYSFNRRQAVVSYAPVPREAVVPLLGAVVYNKEEFATYTTLSLADFTQEKELQASNVTCAVL